MKQKEMMQEVNNSTSVDNPFDAEQYQNIPVMDQPLTMTSSMVDGMLNNDEVPKEVKHKDWWIFHKDNVLGFLDESRKQSKLLNFDIIKGDEMTTLRRKAYTFSLDVEQDILRNVFETKLDRAVGSSNSNMMNERKSLISQISESRQVSENNDSMVKEGFIKKLLGRR